MIKPRKANLSALILLIKFFINNYLINIYCLIVAGKRKWINSCVWHYNNKFWFIKIKSNLSIAVSVFITCDVIGSSIFTRRKFTCQVINLSIVTPKENIISWVAMRIYITGNLVIYWCTTI